MSLMRMVVGALVLTVLTPLAGAGIEQKPVRETEFHIDGGPPGPASLDELWDQAAVVVEGVIAAAHPADVVIADRVLLYTTYEIQVKEAFKSDGVLTRKAPRVFVHRMGGTRDRGDHIRKHVESGFPPFEIGQQYLLFLEPLSGTNSGKYAVAGGTGEGAFLVHGFDMKARGKSEVADTLASNPILFRELLRRKGGAR